MNFDYSDEQRLLQEEVRKLLSRACPITLVRAVLEDPQASCAHSLWRVVADMGWLGTSIPEKYGGLALGHVELCVIAEELGRALAPIPFASTVYLFAEALLRFGSERQQARLLPAVARGELIGCMATSEGPGLTHTDSLAVSVADGRLTGIKLPVTDGNIADQAIVLAADAGRPALFLVDLRGEGVTRERLRVLDPTRDAAVVRFERAPAELLGAPGASAANLQAIFDRAAALMAFEQLGGADRCLELARDYALERHAFGRPIGSYQAIKHKLVDMYIRNQLARSNAYYGAWALDNCPPGLPRAAAAARVAASDAFWFASKEMIEIFGGIGTTWEADCHLYYRRAKQLALVLGAPALWRERLVTELERDTP